MLPCAPGKMMLSNFGVKQSQTPNTRILNVGFQMVPVVQLLDSTIQQISIKKNNCAIH